MNIAGFSGYPIDIDAAGKYNIIVTGRPNGKENC